MTPSQIKELVTKMRARGVKFTQGLTNDEIARVESTFGFGFPPDLRDFLQVALPVSEQFYDWRRVFSNAKIRKNVGFYLDWAWDGIAFDIEKNNFWCGDWGDKPADLPTQLQVAGAHFATYPKLIPIYSHRFMPSLPLSGLPIFSVHQTDIIYYGLDLASYFAAEFDFELSNQFSQIVAPNHRVDFWTWCAERL